MEKYRSSADPSTGVHPFLPAKLPTLSYLAVMAKPLLISIRLPILLTTTLAYIIASIPIGILSMLSHLLARPFSRVRDVLLLRIALVALGCWKTPAPELGRPRTRAAKPGRHPVRGDIVFVNHASYLDVLYLALMYSPVFVYATSDSVVSCSISTALRSSLSGKPPASSKKENLEQISAHAAAPVVLFAEGTTTNGKGVLAFANHLQSPEIPESVSVYALGLSYSASRKEVFTVESFVRHLLRLLGSISCSIRGKALAIPNSGSNPQATVANLAGIPALSIGAEARERFNNHWSQTHGTVSKS